MSCCIIDIFQHAPYLHKVLDDSHYISCHEELEYMGITIGYSSKTQFNQKYGFTYSSIEELNELYDTIIIIFPLLNIDSIHEPERHTIFNELFNYILTLSKNRYKNKFILIDNHDYDYDPMQIKDLSMFTTILKRCYSTTKTYSKRVKPFPFVLFGTIDPLFLLLFKKQEPQLKKKQLFWAGAIYTRIQKEFNVNAQREEYINILRDKSYFKEMRDLSFSEYLTNMGSSSLTLDIHGESRLNKRFYEALSTGTLLLLEKQDIVSPYTFATECEFRDPYECVEKATILLSNDDLYNKCLTRQQEIVNTFFTKEHIQTYFINTTSNITQVVLQEWWGRLGNNLTQLINAIEFASRNKCVFVNKDTRYSNPVKCAVYEGLTYHYDGPLKGRHALIEDFIVNFSDDPDITLSNVDNKCSKKHIDLFYDNPDGDIPNSRKSEILRNYIRDHFVTSPVNIDSDTLVIHIRSGDIFNPGAHGFYVQPPFSFYTKVIDEMKYEKIHIVTEPDLRNPAIRLIKDKYPNTTIQTSSVIEDCSVVLQASHFLCNSQGTFGHMLALMSKNIKNLYLPYYFKPENVVFTDNSFLKAKDTSSFFNMKSISHFTIHEYIIHNYIEPFSWNPYDQIQIMKLIYLPIENIIKR
jgi:hypothetical protein